MATIWSSNDDGLTITPRFWYAITKSHGGWDFVLRSDSETENLVRVRGNRMWMVDTAEQISGWSRIGIGVPLGLLSWDIFHLWLRHKLCLDSNWAVISRIPSCGKGISHLCNSFVYIPIMTFLHDVECYSIGCITCLIVRVRAQLTQSPLSP